GCGWGGWRLRSTSTKARSRPSTSWWCGDSRGVDEAIMVTVRRGTIALAVLGAWVCVAAGTARAGVVAPIRPDLTVDTAATVMVSLYQLDSALAAAVTLQSASRCLSSGTSFYKHLPDS